VSKRFAAKGGVVTALDDVSFDVAEGEIVCLLGTSGGGKSTLLSLIAGLDEASEGEITLDGEPITGRARIGEWCSSGIACSPG
jgi:NitT/TauT family transport system ATP-binding protein